MIKRYLLFLFLLNTAIIFSQITFQAEDDKIFQRNKETEIVEMKNANGKVISFKIPETKSGNIIRSTELPFSLTLPLYTLKIKMAVDNIYGFGRQIQVQIYDTKTKKLIRDFPIYAFLFKENNVLEEIPIVFPKGEGEKIQVNINFAGKGKDIKNVYIDEISISPYATHPYIQNIIPNKVRYKRNEGGNCEVTIVNPTNEKYKEITLEVRILQEIKDEELLYTKNISLLPNEIKVINLPFPNNDRDFGRELKILLKDKVKIIHSRSEYYQVADNIWRVYLQGKREDIGPFCHWPIRWSKEVQDKWDEELKIKYLLGTYTYSNNWERFSWAPGECLDMTPDIEEFWSGQSVYHSTITKLKGQIEAMQKRGVACISYINQVGSGPKAYEVGRKHPEWIASTNGVWQGSFDVGLFETWDNPTQEDIKRRGGSFFYIVPDFKNKEVVDYVIKEIIESTRMFSWDGVRWDCGQLGGIPENIKRHKEEIWKVFPDFVFGYNVGGKDQYERNPEEYKELCAKGGLIMDEGTYAASRKNHFLHNWKRYFSYLVDSQELVQSLGGYYNPFVLNRGGGKYLVDSLYESILQLSARSHPLRILSYRYSAEVPPYLNLCKFLTRYSALFWDSNILFMKNPEKQIEITCNSEIWWKEAVAIREISSDYKQYIIHLINPPLSEFIEENPDGLLKPWIKNVKLASVIPEGFKPRIVYLFSIDTGDMEPQVLDFKIIDKKIEINIPEIKFWKLIVIEFTKGA